MSFFANSKPTLSPLRDSMNFRHLAAKAGDRISAQASMSELAELVETFAEPTIAVLPKTKTFA
jgi:hypothetical protein